jgi:eukaryotic-like serine/threonine-protein kinase
MSTMTRLSAALADRYRIDRELGAGGMATVYLAYDLRHDRKVALKVLRPELSAILGAERFLAEIKTTANLQHPHILGLFDSGQVDGLVFYAMPFVDGESLRDRLDRERQLPVQEAINIAREVADALEYAHQHGVVHRDIKPENILLHGGHAVVADFGIALAAAHSDSGARMTETGMSLGTPHYMSPEQAMGEREITPKADIYALGCVLYEMLTAEPPFQGASAQAIIARVLTEEPRSLTVQRNTIPPHVEAAVRVALAKLPADRFASAKAFGEALGRTDFALASSQARPVGPRAAGQLSARERLLRGAPWVLAAAAIATSVWLASDRPTSVLAPAPVGQFAIALAPEVATSQNGQVLTISPDGSRIVYVSTANNQLFIRMLGQVEPVPIPGTSDALSPFFSPDGEYIAFVVGARLMRVAVSGGPALPVADVAGTFFGGTWNTTGEILFAAEAGLFVVPAAGGVPTLLAAPDSGSSESFRWPEFLPGGRSALIAIWDGDIDHLAAVTLGTGAIQRLAVIGSNPHYVDQGYLIYAMIGAGGGGTGGMVGSGTLMTVPFDPDRLAVLGPPAPVTDSVQVGIVSRTAKLGISPGGTIAFASGSIGMSTIVSVGRDGSVSELGTDERFYQAPRLSPDGRRLAMYVIDTGTDIWVYDLAGKTLSRLTFDGSARFPIWTPDGHAIVYTRTGNGLDLARVPSDGSAPAEALLTAGLDQYSGDFAPDGRTMVIRENIGGRRRIATVALDSTPAAEPLIDSGFDNHSPSLSPDGHWVAYVSNEAGRSEVYVRPFPGLGGKWQVSRDGGTEPRWSPTGQEIFFRSGDAMMTAAVQAGATFVPGEVREIFRLVATSNPVYANYDVTRDGNSFIMARATGTGTQTFKVLLNWFDNLPPRPR